MVVAVGVSVKITVAIRRTNAFSLSFVCTNIRKIISLIGRILNQQADVGWFGVVVGVG